jgi:hypothetical protein
MGWLSLLYEAEKVVDAIGLWRFDGITYILEVSIHS